MGKASKEAMDQLLSRPHVFFWLSIPFVLVIGYYGNEQFSLNFFDTYYVSSSRSIAIYISLGFAFFGLIYHRFLRSGYRLKKWLTLIHMFCTLDMAILFWLCHVWYSNTKDGMNSSIDFNTVFLVLLTIIGFGQLIFILHILSLRLGKSSSSSE
ncbi:MAG: hypothetical protein KJO00_10055 [Bacteroidia bacterium]|nr:hypothetical protein [Bacteroidia bacterium]